jgi:hypothetical protein
MGTYERTNMIYDCDCEFESGTIHCDECLKEFVTQYNKDNPDDQIELIRGWETREFYYYFKKVNKNEVSGSSMYGLRQGTKISHHVRMEKDKFDGIHLKNVFGPSLKCVPESGNTCCSQLVLGSC